MGHGWDKWDISGTMSDISRTSGTWVGYEWDMGGTQVGHEWDMLDMSGTMSDTSETWGRTGCLGVMID